MKNSNNQTCKMDKVQNDEQTAYLEATKIRREAELQPSKEHSMPIVTFEKDGTPIYREEQ